MIYLDNNATTPLHPQVLEAMLPYLQACYGNPSSPHRFGHEARLAVERARQQLADCLGCEPAEIVFCASGTESDNMALWGAARARGLGSSHIVTSTIEHHAVLHTCQALQREGARVTYVPVDADGVVDLRELERSITPETTLVSIMHANNETGVLQPVQEIAAIARRCGVLFHTDAVQTAGKLGKLARVGADLCSFSAHKLEGPKGSGGLYIKRSTGLAPLITGGAQERGRRAGTENVAGIVGLARAMVLAHQHVEVEQERTCRLRQRLESLLLQAVPTARINGAGAARLPNTTSVSFGSVDGEAVVVSMDMLGVCISTGSACSTGAPEPSHVLRAMGLSSQEAQSSVRVSLGRQTSEQDILETARRLTETVVRLKAISSSSDKPTASRDRLEPSAQGEQRG